MRAYSYLRFSSSKQAAGDSLRRQLHAAAEWCAANGAELDANLSFRDLGVSAYDKRNYERGALSLFLDAIRAGKVPPGSVLLVESLDRLSRAQIPDAVTLLQSIVRAGIDVVTLIDGKRWTQDGLNNLADFLYSVVLFSRAHDESLHKSARIRKVYEGRLLRGEKIIANVAPGWLVKNSEQKCWELDGEKADVVRRVFSQYLSGIGVSAIMTQANREKWPIPSHKPGDGWHISLVKRMLQNRAVVGENTLENGEVLPNFYPPVISDEDFARAAALASSKASIPRRRDSDRLNVFQGLLFCGICGSSYVLKRKGVDKRKPHLPEYRAYMCAARVRGVTRCTSWPDAMQFQEQLLAQLYSLLGEAVSVEGHLAKATAELEKTADTLADIEARYSRLLALAEAEDSPPTGILTRLHGLEAELRMAKAGRDVAQGHLAELHSSGIDFGAVDAALAEAVRQLRGDAASREALRLRLLRYVYRIYVFQATQTVGIILRADPDHAHWCPLGTDLAALTSPPELPATAR